MSNALTIDIGDPLQGEALFQNSSGVAADPTLVTFQLATPDGVETDYVLADAEVSNPSVGTWRFDYVALAAGRHVLRVAGVGGAPGAEERAFIVRETEFTTPA